MSDSPVVIPYGSDGTPLTTDPGTPASLALTIQGDPSGTPVPVSGSLSIVTTGLATDAKQDEQTAALEAIQAAVEGTVDVHITDASVAVTAAALPLPSGASTSALQTSGNASLTSIDGKLTNPLPVSGTVAVTGVATSAKQDTGNASLASIDGKLTSVNTRALASGTDSVTIVPSGTQTVSGSLSVSNFPATQEVHVTNTPHVIVDSGTVSIDTTGLATDAKQDTGNASLASIDSKLTNPLPVSGSVTATISGTPNVAVTSSALPSGAATAAKQPALGTAGSASSDVITVQGIASMTALKVDGSGVTQPVSGTVTVTGVATETTLAAISTKTPALGQATMTNSSPVAIASNQSALPVTDNSGSLTVDSAQLPAALVGARLDTNNGAWLGSTAPTVGSKTSANSIPVVIASDQGALTVSGSVTSTVSGTVQANIGTSGFLALDATLTGGTLKAIARGGAKGSTTAADVTSTASGSNHNSLDVIQYDASGNAMPSMDAISRAGFVKVTDGGNTAKVAGIGSAALATDTALVVETREPSQAYCTNINASASTGMILDVNTNRKGATIWNDSAATLYLKLGTIASLTSCTVKIIPDAYYEVPGVYTGRIDGIWSSATGVARVTDIVV